jgi:hypothetical protein
MFFLFDCLYDITIDFFFNMGFLGWTSFDIKKNIKQLNNILKLAICSIKNIYNNINKWY